MSHVSFGTRGGDFGDDDAAMKLYRMRECKHGNAPPLKGPDIVWCMDCGAIRHVLGEWCVPKLQQFGRVK